MRWFPNSRVISDRVITKGSNKLLLPTTSRWKFPGQGQRIGEGRGRKTKDSDQNVNDVLELLVTQLNEVVLGERSVPLGLVAPKRGGEIVPEDGREGLQHRGGVRDSLSLWGKGSRIGGGNGHQRQEELAEWEEVVLHHPSHERGGGTVEVEGDAVLSEQIRVPKLEVACDGWLQHPFEGLWATSNGHPIGRELDRQLLVAMGGEVALLIPSSRRWARHSAGRGGETHTAEVGLKSQLRSSTSSRQIYGVVGWWGTGGGRDLAWEFANVDSQRGGVPFLDLEESVGNSLKGAREQQER
jgi:hypothetical protein